MEDSLDRQALMKRLEERQLELITKKKQLEQRREALTSTTPVEVEPVGEAQILLKSVLDVIEKTSNEKDFNDTSKQPSSNLTMPATLPPSQGLVNTSHDAGFSASTFKWTPSITSSITPKTLDSYEKSVQSDPIVFNEIATVETVPKASQPSELSTLSSKKLRSGVMPTSDFKREESIAIGVVDVRKMCDTNMDKALKLEVTTPPKLLTKEEKKEIMTSPEFLNFITERSKLVERIMGESLIFDTAADYSGALSVEADTTDVEKLKLLDSYCSPDCETRPITDLRQSPKFSEIFFASYGMKKQASIDDWDGCVMVWNLTMPNRPEIYLPHQSMVSCLCTDKFQHNLLIGGTYTGSIVLWDLRTPQKPVQKTPLSNKSHSHPVYSAEIVGTANAYNLVTVDLDGRLCQWSLSKLVNPSETIDLQRSMRAGASNDVAPSCISFAEGDTNTLLCGGEDGSLLHVTIHGTKAGIFNTFDGHYGPVSSLHYHPSIEGSTGYTDLVLSSSFDWTVKLWKPNSHPKPLYSFDQFEDYVYDCKWHPLHPAIFAYTSGEGHIGLLNLAQNWEVSYGSVVNSTGVANKVCWSLDGRRLFAADQHGSISAYTASNDIYQPRQEDLELFPEKVEAVKPDAAYPFSEKVSA